MNSVIAYLVGVIACALPFALPGAPPSVAPAVDDCEAFGCSSEFSVSGPYAIGTPTCGQPTLDEDWDPDHDIASKCECDGPACIVDGTDNGCSGKGQITMTVTNGGVVCPGGGATGSSRTFEVSLDDCDGMASNHDPALPPPASNQPVEMKMCCDNCTDCTSGWRILIRMSCWSCGWRAC